METLAKPLVITETQTVGLGQNAYVDPVEFSDVPEQVISDDSANLHDQLGVSDPEVQRRAPYLQAYNGFASVVDPLLAKLDRSESTRDHAEAVGSGANGTVFPLVFDGKNYVAKVLHGQSGYAQQVDADFRAMVRVAGKPHLAQLKAMSNTQGVVIMETIPGTDLWHTDIEQAKTVTDQQLAEALVTMRDAQDSGVGIDESKGSNFMYDSQEGFGFVDIEEARPMGHPKYQTYADKVRIFAGILTNFGDRRELNTADAYAMKAGEAAVKISLLEKFRAVCLSQPDQDNYAKALTSIEEIIQAQHEFIQNVTTTGWVENELTKKHDSEERFQTQRADMATRVVEEDGFLHVPSDFM